jgi:putative SOS response-associated peptidase YedK
MCAATSRLPSQVSGSAGKRGGQTIESNTIIMTDAAQELSATHDRMPVILSAEAARQWMTADEQDTAKLKALLHPYLPPELEWYRVSTQVNSARGDAPSMIVPIDGEIVSGRSD